MEQAIHSLWAGESALGKKQALLERKRALCSPRSSVGEELSSSGSGLESREKLKVSTEIMEPGKGSRRALSPGAVWELGMFAITKASAFCCHPGTVASIKISSHLSFDLSNGGIPFLFQDCC